MQKRAKYNTIYLNSSTITAYFVFEKLLSFVVNQGGEV